MGQFLITSIGSTDALGLFIISVLRSQTTEKHQGKCYCIQKRESQCLTTSCLGSECYFQSACVYLYTCIFQKGKKKQRTVTWDYQSSSPQVGSVAILFPQEMDIRRMTKVVENVAQMTDIRSLNTYLWVIFCTYVKSPFRELEK